METISNELWLLLEDGRLISMNRHVAMNMVFAGEAEVIPPERVARDGGRFVLLDEDNPRVATGKAAIAPATRTVEAATIAAPERAVTTRPSVRKPG